MNGAARSAASGHGRSVRTIGRPRVRLGLATVVADRRLVVSAGGDPARRGELISPGRLRPRCAARPPASGGPECGPGPAPLGDGVPGGPGPTVELARRSDEEASAVERLQVVDPQRHQCPQPRESGGLLLGGQQDLALEDLRRGRHDRELELLLRPEEGLDGALARAQHLRQAPERQAVEAFDRRDVHRATDDRGPPGVPVTLPPRGSRRTVAGPPSRAATLSAGSSRTSSSSSRSSASTSAGCCSAATTGCWTGR